MINEINNLLNQVAIINKKNEEILDATGSRFNMFKICGVNHYENTHSAIIAEFLNPNGTHGLKSKLLECFIEMLGIKDFNSSKASVKTEYSTKEGRIDILIKDDQNKAIIIENKIYGKDQPEQLKRYSRYAQKYINGYQILYLTLYGQEASEQSGEGVDYVKISYEKDIINWLESCVSIATRYPIVRETIIQYINHLKQLTNQDMSTKNEEEIKEVLSKIENLKAAKAICQNYSATFDVLAKKYFNPKMEEFAKEKALKYTYRTSDETFIRFDVSNLKTNKFRIHFTCSDKRIMYGFYYFDKEKHISIETKNLLHQKIRENDKSIIPWQNEWWPFYSFLKHLSIDAWESDIINSDKFFNDCKEKIETLLAAMEGIDF
ncbi:MAG: PD-(D/E)XK nuclease family protein [Bacteroidales bacterium]|nr:PD-(D/E)XK nuclease family protein [Bacteroidales bacterium]